VARVEPIDSAREAQNLAEKRQHFRDALTMQFKSAKWGSSGSHLLLFDVQGEFAFFEEIATRTTLPRESPLHDLVSNEDGSVIRPATMSALEWFCAEKLDVKTPIIFSVASMLFTVPPTSVPVERVMSLLNQVIDPERSRLKQATVEACACLNDLAALLPAHFDRNVARVLKATGVDDASPSSASVAAGPGDEAAAADALEYWRSQMTTFGIASSWERVRGEIPPEDAGDW
jgi:hypothetical protein